MMEPNTTRQDAQEITIQETTGIMETRSDKEIQEARTSKELGEEERKECAVCGTTPQFDNLSA